MKNLALILFLFTFGWASAQNVPNGDFEAWDVKQEFSPTGFQTLGTVTRTTDNKVGKTAVRLENKAQNKGFGAIANTRFDSGFAYGGIPYEDRPLSLNFWAKYDLAANDKAHIICYFKSNNRVIGIINFQIEGSSANKFLEYSVPITWYSVGLPDSVTFFASSRSLYSNYTRGDGYIIFDDLHFATIYNRNENIDNGEFEDWDTASTDAPQSWFRTEDLLIDQEGDDFGFTWVSKTEDGYKGSAIRLQNQNVGNEIIGGALLSHSDYVNFFKPSFPASKPWKYIEGYYKYDSDNGDSATCLVAMYNKGTLVGGVNFKIGTEASDWTYFAMPITYFVQLVDSATIIIGSADLDKPLGDNTELWLDELRFADWTASASTPEYSKVNIYPNPAGQTIQVSFENEGSAIIEITNLHGVKVMEVETTTFENRLDISSLEPGMYQVTVINNEQRRTQKILKYE